MPQSLEIISATIHDYPAIQKIAQLYIYECSKECGFILSESGQYEPTDYKSFFESPNREANFIKVDNEIAGFILIERGISPKKISQISQFFVLSKFQRRGIGQKVAHRLWKNSPGEWNVSVIPKNIRALSFWRKVISDFTDGHYTEKIKKVDSDDLHPRRYVLSFDSGQNKRHKTVLSAGPDWSIHVDLSPSKEEDEVVLKGLQSFNQTITKTKEIHFSVFAKDASEKIVGGALVYHGRDSAFLDILWVHQDYRKQGLGRSLLMAVEKQALKTKKCKWVKLDTYSFQAPDFYLKCGYELYAEVENFTDNDSKLFFKKALNHS